MSMECSSLSRSFSPLEFCMVSFSEARLEGAQTGFVAGIMAAVLTALAAFVSFTTILEATPLNGPLAVASFPGLPAALVGVGCGAVGLKSDARSQALVGLVLSIASIVAWTVMATIAYWAFSTDAKIASRVSKQFAYAWLPVFPLRLTHTYSVNRLPSMELST